jgi:2-dehydropantoate 2-reductase
MQWHILGAGAIGGLLACKMLRAGIPAQLLCRDREAAAALEHGLELEEESRSRKFPVSATTPAQIESIAALFITTKANQAVAAFRQVQHLLDDSAPVVLLLNGMGVHEQVAQLRPGKEVYCGITTEAAYRAKGALLVHAGAGETRIGRMGGGDPPAWFTEFSTSTEAFIWENNIAASLWRKLLVNCAINPMTAIHGCRNGELMENPGYREQTMRLCGELAAVCRARGEEELAEQLPEIVSAVIRSTARNQSSMLQDVLLGRPTEIDFISGYLCREAHRLGVPCPLNESLWKQLS